MSLQYSSMIVACIALIASIGTLLYIVKTTRQTKYMRDELSEQRKIGVDAWVEKHIQRWRDGKLSSRIEKGTGVSGTDVEIIEPLPGWPIVVETTISADQRRKWARKYAGKDRIDSSIVVDLNHTGFAD